jgi:hypothetical protein
MSLALACPGQTAARAQQVEARRAGACLEPRH